MILRYQHTLSSLILVCALIAQLSCNLTQASSSHPLLTPSYHPRSHHQAGRSGHGLVGDILRTLVGVMPVTPAPSTRDSMDIEGQNNQQLTHQYAYQPQDVLQPLCARFPSISYTRRGPLVQMALHALGPGALPACTAVLLAHALSAYDPEAEEAPALLPSAASERKLEDAAGAPAKGLILLSRSSQRKATRAMRTSQPEEFFRLAMESVLSRPGIAQPNHPIDLLVTPYESMYTYIVAICYYPTPLNCDTHLIYHLLLTYLRRSSGCSSMCPGDIGKKCTTATRPRVRRSL